MQNMHIKIPKEMNRAKKCAKFCWPASQQARVLSVGHFEGRDLDILVPRVVMYVRYLSIRLFCRNIGHFEAGRRAMVSQGYPHYQKFLLPLEVIDAYIFFSFGALELSVRAEASQQSQTQKHTLKSTENSTYTGAKHA